jgi:hypothetical protein
MKNVVISGSQPSYQDEMRRIAQIFRIMRILRSVNGTVFRIIQGRQWDGILDNDDIQVS